MKQIPIGERLKTYYEKIRELKTEFTKDNCPITDIDLETIEDYR